mmetsp:Transcript_42943/g.100047  ORF Transcript_42943/g.100047 Transcript_42943/m.100047 type:complete len:153 (-) Transcript_42943:359-817(-)
MCLFVPMFPDSGPTGSAQKTSRGRRRISKANVGKLLAAAAEASADAGDNNSLKRRIRQRLHKKLGSILNKNEFAAAMEDFKNMEEQTSSLKTASSTASTCSGSEVGGKQSFASQDVEKATDVLQAFDFELPVERTFIHFKLQLGCQRRSRSA